MKRIYYLLLLIMLSVKVYAPGDGAIPLPEPAELNPHLDIWEAVCWVESRHNAKAINVAEQAYGIAQIRECKLNDYNKVWGSAHEITDCFNTELSRKIFMWHCAQYDNQDEAVRRWNGSGPATYEYLAKVRGRILSVQRGLK